MKNNLEILLQTYMHTNMHISFESLAKQFSNHILYSKKKTIIYKMILYIQHLKLKKKEKENKITLCPRFCSTTSLGLYFTLYGSTPIIYYDHLD